MSKEVFSPFISVRLERPLTWMNRREVVEIGGEEFVKVNSDNPTYCQRDEHHHDSEADAVRDLIEQLEEQILLVAEAYEQEIAKWKEKLAAIETEVTE